MSSDEEDSGSEGEVELNLEFDENGRIGSWGGKVDFGFRSFTNAVQLTNKPQILSDCQSAFTARSTGKKGGYSAGDTFWLPANAVPRNGLEQMAKDIFTFHTKDAKGLTENSGAEWWTLVLDPEDAEVGFHWDKDYTVESDCNVNVFPHISTVTYINSAGAPTLVLDKTAPVQYGDPLTGPSDRVWISKPIENKHISFDGRFLHGAPSELLEIWNEKTKEEKKQSKSSGRQNKKRKKESTSEMRVTFLVNVWLNHKPVGSVNFEDPSLKSSPDSAHLVLNEKNQTVPDKLEVNKGTTVKNFDKEMNNKKIKKDEFDEIKIMSWSFKQTKKHTLQVPLPVSLLSFSPANVFVIDYKNKLKPTVS